MQTSGVDVLISAPQKGWSASPSCALVMFSQRALEQVEQTSSNSFACDLKKWLQIMRAYENGGHAYHATLPTDALRQLRDTMLELQQYGFDRLSQQQWQLQAESSTEAVLQVLMLILSMLSIQLFLITQLGWIRPRRLLSVIRPMLLLKLTMRWMPR